MKIRNGFVSNSSSSSFIVAVARIVDEAKFNEWVEQLKPSTYDYNYGVCTLESIKANKHYSVELKGNEVIVESFQTDARVNIDGLGDGKIFYVNIINDEGDTGIFSGYDYYTDEYVGIDYDISLDDFNDDQIKLYSGIYESNGFANIDCKYGAGRNG